ncbi:hypothetical protein V9K95_14680 [Phyllobacterium sp. CCNWLW183]
MGSTLRHARPALHETVVGVEPSSGASLLAAIERQYRAGDIDGRRPERERHWRSRWARPASYWLPAHPGSEPFLLAAPLERQFGADIAGRDSVDAHALFAASGSVKRFTLAFAAL